jgi:hypothetical protein
MRRRIQYSLSVVTRSTKYPFRYHSYLFPSVRLRGRESGAPGALAWLTPSFLGAVFFWNVGNPVLLSMPLGLFQSLFPCFSYLSPVLGYFTTPGIFHLLTLCRLLKTPCSSGSTNWSGYLPCGKALRCSPRLAAHPEQYESSPRLNTSSGSCDNRPASYLFPLEIYGKSAVRKYYGRPVSLGF